MISQRSYDFLADKFLSPLRPTSKPMLYSMAGIPGAGKSRFVFERLQAGDFPKDAFILNPDLLMEALPEYDKDHKGMGSSAAFEKWEIPVRKLAYEFYEKAASLKSHIIKDMGNSRIENLDKVESLKQAGYEVRLFFIYADIGTALRRVQTRNRHTAAEMIKQRYVSLKEIYPKLIKLSDHNRFFDNRAINKPFRDISKDELSSLFEVQG